MELLNFFGELRSKIEARTIPALVREFLGDDERPGRIGRACGESANRLNVARGALRDLQPEILAFVELGNVRALRELLGRVEREVLGTPLTHQQYRETPPRPSVFPPPTPDKNRSRFKDRYSWISGHGV